MAEITTASVYEHEIAKRDDFQYGFTSLIRNTALLDRALVSSDRDYVIGGIVIPETGALGVRVTSIWGNGRDCELPVFCEDTSEVIPINAPIESIRVDIVQIRAVLEEFDVQRRAFFNPEVESGQYFNVPTKLKLKNEYRVKPGIEGRQIAPEADTGWIKIAEIELEPLVTRLLPENIKNITAIYQSELNTEWTNERDRTFNLGSLTELKSMFAVEHQLNGRHRPRVIKAGNIAIGVGTDELKSTVIPLGQNIDTPAISMERTISIYDALVRLLNLIEKNGSGGGGEGFELGLAIHALKFYSKTTIMFTNARIVDRRQKGWDIGLRYLSDNSEVYHFDTDTRNQHQQQNISIIPASGSATPRLLGKDEMAGGIYMTPAVLENPPHEMMGRSLYGEFSISGLVTGENSTIDFFARLMNDDSFTLFRVGTDVSIVLTKDPDLSVAGENGIELCISPAGQPELSLPKTSQTGIETPGSEDVLITIGSEDPELCVSGEEEPTLCVSPEGQPELSKSSLLGNRIIHSWPGGNESVDLDSEGISFPERIWLHIGVMLTASQFILFIGTQQIALNRKSLPDGDAAFAINPGMNEINIDELMIDRTVCETIEQFSENTQNRIPWAALDYRQKWAVIQVHDPALLKTNIFDGDAFSAAWQREYAKQQLGG